MREELSALEDLDFNIDLLGFNAEEIDNLFLDDANASGGLTDEDAAPEIPENPISVPGDIWICGDHKVLCGDSTMIDKVLDDEGYITMSFKPAYAKDRERRFSSPDT